MTTKKPDFKEQAEITAVFGRLKAASKMTKYEARRMAEQIENDLYRWRIWQSAAVDGSPGYLPCELPRLPRRIRVALAKLTAPCVKREKDLKNKVSTKRIKKCHSDISTVQGLSKDEAREIVASNYGTCRAIAMRTIGRYRLAEDCVSESMVSALEQIADGKVTFASANKAAAWICQIVRYNAARVLRTLTNMSTIGDFLPSKGILPSYGRQGTPPGIHEQAEPPREDDDDCRTIGRKKHDGCGPDEF
ncbi:MAG TPA: hypothetical protein VGH51_02090 [Candidatus Angelobacter sp.]|jgi:hypothetical protein